MPNSIKRISLWSGPRNISTTLMYSFAQRNDTQVFDEPLYAHYLNNTNASNYHPSATTILDSQENEGVKVLAEMQANNSAPVLFYKNMTHHLVKLDFNILRNFTNVLLTRDPKEMLPSYAAVINNPSLNDVGYKAHWDLVEYFNKNSIPFVVLDSTKVLLNPKDQLQKLCSAINIPFSDAMLSWKKGNRKEDGVWAKHWYKNIHNSTGFMKYKAKTAPFPEKLKPLLEKCLPYYNKLKKLSI